VSNITIRNVTGEFHTLGTLRGNPGDTLKDITLENVDLKLTETDFSPGDVKNLVFKNVKVNGTAFSRP
jgi:hypothetical protein